MSKSAQVGVLSDDSADCEHASPLRHASSRRGIADSHRASNRHIQDDDAAPIAPGGADGISRQSSSITLERVLPRQLSTKEQILVRKTSVVLSNPAAADTIFSHAEMKRLEVFTAKYMGKLQLASSRDLRSHRVRTSVDATTTVYSELQPSLGLSELAHGAHDAAAGAPEPLPSPPQPEWLLRLRVRMKRVVKANAFRAAVHFVVLADMAVLALDDEYSTASAVYARLDIAFTLLIGLEIVLKSIAFGLYDGHESYLRRSRFRILNIVVLIASLASYLGGRKFRVLRGIKTYRSLTMYAGLRRILRSLIRAVPFLANVGTLALFFLLAFSIFGLEAFNGAFDNQCSVAVDVTAHSSSSANSSGDFVDQLVYEALPRVFCAEAASCATSNQTCFRLGPPSQHVNFDSGLSSIFLVFLVVAQDGWVTDIMEPVLEGKSYWTVVFFVGIIVSMVFLVVNLFVAVITTAFMNFTIDANSDEQQPRFMGKKDNDEEETHVSLIMGATLAIEESMQSAAAAGGHATPHDENDDDDDRDSKRTSRMSTAIGTASPPPEVLLDGKAREAIGMLAQTHQWKSIRDTTAEAAKELIQTPSSLEEFMIPFAQAYQRHTSSPKNTTGNRRSVGESSSSDVPLPTRRSSAGSRKPTVLADIHEHASIAALADRMNADAAATFARFQALVFSKRFDDIITGCIAVNTLFLLLEYPNMSDALRLVLSVSEYLFGSIFAIEMLARIVAMKGLRAYLRTTERKFDMVVVVCTTVNMVLNNVDTSFSGLNSVSSLRTLRVSRLMLKWEGTRKLIMSVLKSSRGIMDVVVFLVLFQVINSILAMQLFGGAHLHSADNTPRWNFDTFGRSFLTLLQVITGDQWSSVTYDAVDAEDPHWFLVPFLIVIFIIGQYVLLNLFIAVILDNFAISEEEAYQLQLAQIIAIPKELDIFEAIEEHGVRAFGEMDQLDNVSNVKLRMFLGLDDKRSHVSSGAVSGVSNGRFIRTNAQSKNTGASSRSSKLHGVIASARRHWQSACIRLACSVWYSRFIQLVVIVSCFNLILDDPHPEMSQTPPSDELVRAVAIVNQLALAVFFVEFVVKVGAFGFGFDYLRIALFFHDEQLGYVNKQAYMEDRWNQLDFVLLVIAIIDEVVTGLYPEMSAAGVFRAGRVLRPLRILNHNHDMKAILTAVARSVPQVGNVFALCMIVYVIFGVVGRSLFAGKFYACNDASVKTAAECIGFFVTYPDGALSLQEATARGVSSGAILVPRVWANARFSFDHIGVAFLALLEMTSLKWIDKTFAAMDIAGIDKQPVQDTAPEYAIFFVLYVYVGSLFVIRLFVGVLVEQFQRNDGTQILTESQKSWVDLEKFILLLQPLRLIPRPRLRVLDKLYDFCQNPRFANAISAAILLNILLLLINPSATSGASTSYKVIEIIFLAIFTAEALVKCLAFRHYYLLSPNGVFEVGILIGSLAAYFSSSGYHSLIQAGRVFRVMRVLRVVKLNRGVYAVFQTFRASLRPIGHIFLLMCTLIYIFAVVARQLFGGVKFGPAMNHFSNFRTFGSSVLLLFQIMSGDDWHLTMTDCMVRKPFCSERVYEKTGEIVTDCGSVSAASTFFAMYVTIVVFIFLNLFVTVILENFRSCYLKSDVCAISLLDFEAYREVFQKYDVYGSGTFPLWQLASFLEELPPGLRIDRKRQRRAFLQIRSQVQALLAAESSAPCGPWRRRPYFNELLRVLCIHQMGIRSLPYEQQRDRVKQIFIYRAKVAQMIVESVVKGYVYRWRQRKQRTAADDEQQQRPSITTSSNGGGADSATCEPNAESSETITASVSTRHSIGPTETCDASESVATASSTHTSSAAADAVPPDSQEDTAETNHTASPRASLPVLPDQQTRSSEDVLATRSIDKQHTKSSSGPPVELSEQLQAPLHQDQQYPPRRHRHRQKRPKKHPRPHTPKLKVSADTGESTSDAASDDSDVGLRVPMSEDEAHELSDSDTIVVVAKSAREPMEDPASASSGGGPSQVLPRRLPQLKSPHHTSKVVPT